MHDRRVWCITLVLSVVVAWCSNFWAEAADVDILRPRVPTEQIPMVRNIINPLPPTPEILQKGRDIFHGKGFCAICHGRDGKGLGKDLELKGALPRNFTDSDWQAARSDGELFWILKNGSKGTAMASFIPLVLSEEEAWEVIIYVRSFAIQ